MLFVFFLFLIAEEMASPRVEIASLRSNFGCILRDRNQRQNLISDENSQNRVVNKPKKKNKSRLGSPEKQRTRKGNNFSDSTKRSENRGASSLVQIWEARLNRSRGGNSPIHGQATESVQEETNLPAPPMDGDSESENESKSRDPTVEIDSGVLNTVPDSGESKWGRVAEIIRKLKLTAGDNVGAVDDMISVKTEKQEKSSLPVVTCSPRLRGRQAFSDLLMRLERDRHRELETLVGRNAVSKFTQRGRLQSMLRLRTLKRGLLIQERHRSSVKTPDLIHLELGSTVLHLRERFRTNITSETERKKGQQTNLVTERSTESMKPKETSILLETSPTEGLSPRNRKTEEANSRKKETEPKISYLQLQESMVPEFLKRETDNTISHTILTLQEPRTLEKEVVESRTYGTQETPFLKSQETPLLESQETSLLESQETTLLESQETSFRWEEQEDYEDEQFYYGEMSNDWFTEISRPRTYWEDLRKSRYLEVMNTRSDKDDICKLLERRTVSDFLQSGLREKIDKLMMSRVQTHPVQRTEESGKEEQECDIGQEEDEIRDDLSHTSSQLFAPSPAGSWSSQDIGVSSTPDLSHLHNPQSTEMEIISEMRSQIVQLQLEMSELRDSVKTCLDVNASLQKSVHLENPLKRKCCVCNDTQVETLLYRCGHMCTCLRCANELLYNGGKCPICRAKILDVVRVFFDSST